MIASGKKTEEYREIKDYWAKRLLKDYDAILFRNGYRKDAPRFLIEYRGITQGYGRSDWGGDNNKVYILHLGKILD